MRRQLIDFCDPYNHGLKRPWVPVKITYLPSALSLTTFSLLDTGADGCVAPIWLSRSCGVDLKSVVPKTTGGIGGSQQMWPHDFRIEVLNPRKLTESVFTIDVVPFGCTEEANLPVLLGTFGFLERFEVKLDYPQKVLSLAM